MPSNGPDSQSQQQSAHHTEQNQQPHKQPQPHPQPPPQWWMAMQYQAAPMIMHDPMMPPQHYMPLSSPHRIPYGRPPHQVNGQQHQQHQQPPHQESTSENKTIWVGDLQHWMDENYLHSCFASTGEYFDMLFFNKVRYGYGSNGSFTHGHQSDGDSTNTTHRADYSNQWSGAAYYGGQMYGGYGYAMPLPYDPPTMYAAASYGAYPMYGTHQQQVS
ncbi:Polyadenylate-binding protein RBP47 [Cucurbita argyrosperma subsp. argyrosperma]|nr:Polyadenylate-binding protein RBP47 [Cucurbita argyrosperma subsp. argyrosperma]